MTTDREAALHWATTVLGRHHVETTGPVTWPHERTWSALARIPTTRGAAWLKVVPDELRHEAALTALVASRRPDATVVVHGHEPDRGWLLLGDAGRSLRTLVPEDGDLSRWRGALRLYAGLQRDLAGDVEAMLAAGVPDLRGQRLLTSFVALVEELDLGADARAAVPEVGALVDALADAGVPDSVQHDDLHDAQVFVDDDGRTRITDWGDACVAHPFLTLAVTLDGVIGWGMRDVEGSEDVLPYQRGYLEVWAEHLGRSVASLEPSARAARALGWACRVVNGHVPGDPDPTAARVRMLLSALQRLR
ncbi:MAG: hypothetical protein KAG80_09200 [Nocardioides sp.]|nr:hypothetical protein [Nocardioides sp.]